MDKCTFCAGGPEAHGSQDEFEKYGRNRLAEGKLPACAEQCSTKALLAGDGDVVADIFRNRVVQRGKGAEVWGWGTAYACGDKPQSIGGVKSDVAPYQGVDNKFAAPGWKAGDKTSWEQALKARTQNTQNEYTPLCFGGWVHAQAPATAVLTPAVATPGGIQGQNIFAVKPDADLDPKYATQTNAERAKVQPGNNAPIWRQVGS
eukprot:gene58611-78192_t